MKFQKGHKINLGKKNHKGKKHTKEVRKKIRERTKLAMNNSNIKRKISNSHKGKLSPMKNKKHTLESRKKMSISLTGRKQSEKTKRKISLANKGRKKQPLSEEHKKSISKSCKGRTVWNKGKKMPNEFKKKCRERQLGVKFSEESKYKMGLSKRGKKHWNWQGGKSFEIYGEDWTEELKDSIRKRDNYICQECGLHQDELQNRISKLDVHHIDYDKNNYNPENLITLCRSCHIKTNKNREYWINYFKKI